jgi:drug/metabolite transporter (DMT)-like permease
MPGVVWATLSGVAFGFSQVSNRGVNRNNEALAATTALVSAMAVAVTLAAGLRGDLAELPTMPGQAVGWFVAAALVHFLVGWTLFAMSQQRLGPSRTASVLSINPVVAALVAALVISERLRPVTWVGVITVTIGVGVVAMARAGDGPRRLIALTPILAATLMFSISPIFVRFGLDHFDRPLTGLVVGMAVTVPCMHLSTRALTGRWVRLSGPTRGWLALGAASAGLAVVAQWTAFDLIPVGAVVSLQQLSTPVVLLAGPLLLGSPRERPDARLLLGTALILGGAVLVALFGRALT